MKFRLLILGLMIIVFNLIACDTGGEKKFYAKPSSLDFGEVYPNETKKIYQTFVSYSDTTISISKIEVTGSTLFSATPSGNVSISIHPGSRYDILVDYSPTM